MGFQNVYGRWHVGVKQCMHSFLYYHFLQGFSIYDYMLKLFPIFLKWKLFVFHLKTNYIFFSCVGVMYSCRWIWCLWCDSECISTASNLEKYAWLGGNGTYDIWNCISFKFSNFYFLKFCPMNASPRVITQPLI